TSDTDAKYGKNRMKISTVIDINEIDMEEHRRVSNTLLAVMNSKDSKLSNSTINIQHYQKDKNLKIMLWGDIKFTKEMLDFISILTNNNDI
ncbi:MAG: hypothetical protein ACRC3Y_03865, partial [Romboutsia sp.]|uniref:hypothetical protein n=1 Tax=Romboutsia sp. TaxID=1965302 RepID=UPI003F321064